ncbi:MAG TPA: PH domain-containing protein [Streptosporangiaceae bacterium]|nr:PH domain-containing protein [Streptosporangiaceae bacterium]
MRHDSSLIEGEQSVFIMHPHWKTVIGPIVILAVVVVAAAAALVLIPFGSAATIGRGVVAGIALIVAAVLSGIPILRWRTTTYELTTRRLRMREGILSRFGRDIPLNRVNDVSFSHGIIDRVLGCGKLVVESAGEHGQLVLTEIPQVEKVQSILYQLVEEQQQTATAMREER